MVHQLSDLGCAGKLAANGFQRLGGSNKRPRHQRYLLLDPTPDYECCALLPPAFAIVERTTQLAGTSISGSTGPPISSLRSAQTS